MISFSGNNLCCRAGRASAVSPAAFSRRAKSTSRATAAPLTGPTETVTPAGCLCASAGMDTNGQMSNDHKGQKRFYNTS